MPNVVQARFRLEIRGADMPPEPYCGAVGHTTSLYRVIDVESENLLTYRAAPTFGANDSTTIDLWNALDVWGEPLNLASMILLRISVPRRQEDYGVVGPAAGRFTIASTATPAGTFPDPNVGITTLRKGQGVVWFSDPRAGDKWDNTSLLRSFTITETAGAGPTVVVVEAWGRR